MPYDTYQSCHQFSAVTFDTSSCRDDYRARLAVMTQELKVLAPDILLLQNVFATADNHYNTAGHLARQLHMHCAFLPMRPKTRFLDGRAIQSHCGLAILSRHPIMDTGRCELPCDPRDGQRIAQFADIDLERTRLLVANIQVSHLAGADAARRHQIEKLAERLADAHDFDHILVGGDFNAARIEPALDPIRSLPGFAVAEAAPERGVDRLFALTRCTALCPIPPIVLADIRPELDGADPITNLFAGDRAALAAELALSTALAANVIPVGGMSIRVDRAQIRSEARPEPRISAFQTAAE